MIISASRRTDIPALYGEWFMNRIRAGWCAVPNPMNLKQISGVSLHPAEVDAIVFWSKNPSPFMPHLAELDGLGFRYYFQFTLNAYPGLLEPNIPSLDDRLATFLHLSRRLGPLRVIWRYDPIIISNLTPIEYHRERFEFIAKELRGATRRVVVSLVDLYQKTERRLAALEYEGFLLDRRDWSFSAMNDLMTQLAGVAERNEMDILLCAERPFRGGVEIKQGRCIDDQLIRQVWALDLNYKKDPYQREYCQCMISKDIGMNDTCVHGCPYCYSTTNYRLAERRHSEHDPNSPLLWANSEMLALAGTNECLQGRLLV